MLCSMMRLIFKTSSVTSDFFYVFNLILSFSTCSESFEKFCAWELLGANVLKRHRELYVNNVCETGQTEGGRSRFAIAYKHLIPSLYTPNLEWMNSWAASFCE